MSRALFRVYIFMIRFAFHLPMPMRRHSISLSAFQVWATAERKFSRRLKTTGDCFVQAECIAQPHGHIYVHTATPANQTTVARILGRYPQSFCKKKWTGTVWPNEDKRCLLWEV